MRLGTTRAHSQHAAVRDGTGRGRGSAGCGPARGRRATANARTAAAVPVLWGVNPRALAGWAPRPPIPVTALTAGAPGDLLVCLRRPRGGRTATVRRPAPMRGRQRPDLSAPRRSTHRLTPRRRSVASTSQICTRRTRHAVSGRGRPAAVRTRPVPAAGRPPGRAAGDRTTSELGPAQTRRRRAQARAARAAAGDLHAMSSKRSGRHSPRSWATGRNPSTTSKITPSSRVTAPRHATPPARIDRRVDHPSSTRCPRPRRGPSASPVGPTPRAVDLTPRPGDIGSEADARPDPTSARPAPSAPARPVARPATASAAHPGRSAHRRRAPLYARAPVGRSNGSTGASIGGGLEPGRPELVVARRFEARNWPQPHGRSGRAGERCPVDVERAACLNPRDLAFAFVCLL